MKNERAAALTAARHLLESDATPEPEQICSAIADIGKPYDAKVIAAHAALVATYLNHPNHVVRYEAVWFLGSWGRLREYASRIYDTACMDSDVYNRAFAARSLGSILKQEKDASLTKSLLAFIENDQEEIEVRLSAYSGLLYAWNKEDSFAFLLGDKAISEIDIDFLKGLHAWTQGQAEIPRVTPQRGVFHSLARAIRMGLI